jgi:hypothetical protein
VLHHVTLTANSFVEAHVDIEAATLEEAHEKALQYAREGNAEWLYDGVDDSTLEVEESRVSLPVT